MKTIKLVFLGIIFLASFSAFAQKVDLILPLGHQRALTRAIFSPNGKQVFTASSDQTISIWDTQAGREVRKLRGSGQTVNDIAVSPNGRYIVSASEDGNAFLWNAATGKVIQRISLAFQPVKKVWFSPLSNFLAIGTQNGKDATLSFWQLPSGTKDREFAFPGERILDIKLSLQKKSIFVLTSNGILHNIDGNTFAVTKVEYGHTFLMGHIDPTCSAVAAISGKGLTVDVYAIDKPDQIHSIATKGPISTVFLSYDSKFLFVGAVNGSLSRFNIATGEEDHEFRVAGPEAKGIDISSDGKFMLSANADGSADLYDLTKRVFVRRFEGKSVPVADFSLLAADSRIVTMFGDKTIKQWKLGDRISMEKMIDLEIKQRLLSVSLDGKKMTTSGDRQSRVINGTTVKKWAVGPAPVKSAVLSPDGKWCAYLDTNDKVFLGPGDMSSFKEVAALAGTRSLRDIQFDSTGRQLIVGDLFSIKALSVPDGKQLQTFTIEKDTIRAFAVSRDSKLYAVATRNSVMVFHPGDPKPALTLSPHNIFLNGPKISKLRFSHDGKYLAVGSTSNLIHLMDLVKGSEVQNFYGHADSLTNIIFNAEGTHLVSSSLDHTLRMWPVALNKAEAKVLSGVSDTEARTYSIMMTAYDSTAWNSTPPTQLERASFIALKSDDWIILTPDGFYFCNKGATRDIGYNKNGKYYGFEQFDLKFNRPDIVLKRIGSKNQALIDAYYKAYQKRLKKLGFTESMLSSDIHVPEVGIGNRDGVPSSTEKKELTLQVIFSDQKASVSKLKLEVNDVPVFGSQGLDVAKGKRQRIDTTFTLRLSNGNNKISASCINEAGAESTVESIEVLCSAAETTKPKLFLITIGASNYRNASMNLRYATKDAKDLAEAFRQSQGTTREIIPITLFDKEVTVANVEAIKKRLLTSDVNDEVILFIAGHGLLDKDLSYYLATYDIDFKNPADKGLPYEKLAAILDGIPARKKLMMMDACHSGELDSEEMTLVKTENKIDAGDISFRAMPNTAVKQLGLENSFELMKELFSDLRKGNGATVISSAGGAEYAMEGAQWNNGVFTYCLLDGLKNKKADLNKDGKVMLSELQSFLNQQVSELTNGKQKPTSRAENLSVDWRVW